MALYSPIDIERVKNTARIEDFVPGEIVRKSNRMKAKCPQCGEMELCITDNSKYRNIHCFKCGFNKSGVFDVVQYYQNLSFPEAVKYVADRYSIPIETEQEQNRRMIRAKQAKIEDTFCFKQLQGSGLELEDVTAKVKSADGKGWQVVPTFTPGTIDTFGTVDLGDDMLIHYYNLYGEPMKVNVKAGARKAVDYIRPRWSLPEAHNGGKYGAIKGAKARFYFPQRIRSAFQDKEPIDTLIIQEGEKKAEKACKHGIPSIAIQGIYNIGNKEDGLISDLQILVKSCKIKKLVLLFDSDWDHLSKNIQQGDAIDQRPAAFARAAIKFKTYVDTLNYNGLSIDIYFGHINENANDDKGIDDLLCNTLKGSEDLLAEDIRQTIGTINGMGEYVSIHKISTVSDFEIMNYWNLRDKDKFFAKHASRIRGLGRVKFGKVIYVEKEDGKFVRSTTSGTDKDFWNVVITDKDGREKKDIEFDLPQCLDFCSANGFARIDSPELGEMDYSFVLVEKGIARVIADFKIRDFVYDFVVTNCKDNDVIKYFAMKIDSLMGRGKLERLRRTEITEFYEPDSQFRYYINGEARISADDIEFSPMTKTVWNTAVIQRRFERRPIFESVEKMPDGSYKFALTADGDKCEFLQYLINTSNFVKEKDPRDYTQDERNNIYHNLINKITAIGYLLNDYRNPSEEKVIVAMDGRMSEVGKSNGRSGKSLVGKAIEHMVEQAFIDGKQLTGSDEYLFSDVTPRSRNVFFDDVKPHFNFTLLFAAVTGPLQVNPKTMARFKIEYEKVPKIYVTTNHAIDDDSNSAKDRMVPIIFSDWYNLEWKPFHEFGHTFFNGWDEYQWSLFDNLMAECVMIYLRSRQLGWSTPGCGVIHPPTSNAEKRQLRQKMGEAFLQWAELFYQAESGHLNERINSKELYKDFCEDCPGQQRFVSPQNFREKIQAFCGYAGFHFNPFKLHKEKKISYAEFRRAYPDQTFVGERDNSGGTVYFTVCTQEFADNTIK
ncbi:MAG: DUF3854 domain-containing protein [Bacteroides sp.]|nr:DUF3854 domain-containing protein [Bacteroides sp.]